VALLPVGCVDVSSLAGEYAMKVNKGSLALLCLYLSGIAVVLLGYFVLPEKYYYDSENIRSLTSSLEGSSTLFNSYANTARLYGFVGLNHSVSFWLVGLASYTLAFLTLLLVFRKKEFRWNWRIWLILSVWNFILAIYVGQYSKELVAILVVGLILYISGRFRLSVSLFMIVLVGVLYALAFRIYWFLVVAIFLVNIFFLYMPGRGIKKFILYFAVVGGVFLSTHLATGEYLTDTRVTLNVGREGDPDSVTMFTNLLPNTSLLTDMINGLYAWLLYLFPVYLFKTGMWHHVIFALWQAINVVIFIRLARYVMNRTRGFQGRYGRRANQRSVAAVAWCMSFSFVQSLFEPDFGSFVKHQIVLLPMYFYLLLFYYGRVLEQLPGMTTRRHVRKQQIISPG
jgi:hypothetical protein